MLKAKLSLSLSSLVYIGVLLILVQGCQAPAFADAKDKNKKFDLKINTTDYLKPDAGPSLKREDIDNAGDPFGSGSGEDAFDAPAGSFDVQTPKSDPPPFNLNADQGGGFDGQNQPPQMDQVPPVQDQMIRQTPTAAVDPNDPDSSQEMQLAWDQWHQKVAESIYFKFNALAKTAFARSRSRLACRVAYTVNRNHQLGNIRMLQNSPNLIFNTMVYGVLKSMNNNQLLEFPMGSRRMTVEKTGTFLWNFQMDGYKYQTNDRETIQQRQR